ncbi:MAG: hypothetical protein FD169_772 [Bacillota bacterium]|nr:MAG: hypothetical protein FD169_772 [Bacillota bacterium]MBS3951229.1 tRNA (adenosine(37)-N6)-threonylcarbamoyltransferase complex ATPase subunit type 1 TsaE [Peptococcaceae bacterium]
MMNSLTTRTALELQQAGEHLGQLAMGGEVIILSGELGAGKTTFAQGVARGLGVTDYVTSPTFTLIHTYHGRLTLVHCDFYRLKNLQEAMDIGFLDYLVSDSIVLIEWGEAYIELMPKDYLHITIEPHGEGRLLQVSEGNSVLEKWVSTWQS